MPLSLKTVEPARGARWVSDAWRLFVRRPMTFCAALAAWLLGGMLLSALLPVVGSVLMLMSPPLFSLGFMIAGQSVLLDGPVRPRQFVEPLLGDKARRNALLVLCLLYAALVTLVTVLVMHIADAPLASSFIVCGLGVGLGAWLLIWTIRDVRRRRGSQWLPD